MQGVCIAQAYADAWHMDMFGLSIFFRFPVQIRFPAVPDLPIVTLPRRTVCHNMWWLIPLLKLPDVVFTPSPVIRRAGAKKGTLRLSAPWYTSGKFEIEEKSDQAGTGIR